MHISLFRRIYLHNIGGDCLKYSASSNWGLGQWTDISLRKQTFSICFVFKEIKLLLVSQIQFYKYQNSPAPHSCVCDTVIFLWKFDSELVVTVRWTSGVLCSKASSSSNDSSEKLGEGTVQPCPASLTESYVEF